MMILLDIDDEYKEEAEKLLQSLSIYKEIGYPRSQSSGTFWIRIKSAKKIKRIVRENFQ